MVPTDAGASSSRLRSGCSPISIRWRRRSALATMRRPRGRSESTTQCYTCYHWLPRIIADFAKEWPDVTIHIVPEATRSPHEAVSDAGAMWRSFTITSTLGRCSTRSCSTMIVAVMSPSHPLAKAALVHPRELNGSTSSCTTFPRRRASCSVTSWGLMPSCPPSCRASRSPRRSSSSCAPTSASRFWRGGRSRRRSRPGRRRSSRRAGRATSVEARRIGGLHTRRERVHRSCYRVRCSRNVPATGRSRYVLPDLLLPRHETPDRCQPRCRARDGHRQGLPGAGDLRLDEPRGVTSSTRREPSSRSERSR